MPVVDKDYIVRMVKQVADLFARLIKLVEKKEYDRAIQVLQGSCPSLVGLDYGPLTFADAESAARLLTDRERIKIFAQLVAKEAELLELKEDPSASDKRRFAAELWAEALLRGSPIDPAQTEGLRALRDRVGVESLGERHRTALAKI